MSEDRVIGTAKNLGGKVQEGVGRLTGDAGTQAEGKLNQLEGTLQDLYGQAVDSAGTAAQAVRERAVTFEEAIRSTVETRPYTAVLAAMAIGWLIGRSGRL